MQRVINIFEVNASVYALCWVSADVAAIGLSNGYVVLYNAKSDVQIGVPFKLTGAVYALEFNKHQNILLVGTSKGELIAIDLFNFQIVWSGNVGNSIHQIRIQRAQILIGLASGVLLVYSLDLMKLAEFPLAAYGIKCMHTVGDESIFIGLKSNEVIQLESNFFNVVETFTLENERPTSLNFDQARNILFVGSNHGVIHCWKLGLTESKIQFQLHQGAIYGIEFNRDLIVTLGFDKHVKFWDAQAFDVKGSLKHDRSVNVGKWSSEGIFLAGGDDKKVSVISVSH